MITLSTDWLSICSAKRQRNLALRLWSYCMQKGLAREHAGKCATVSHYQAFAAVDIALAEAVMNLCAVVIENARLDMEASSRDINRLD